MSAENLSNQPSHAYPMPENITSRETAYTVAMEISQRLEKPEKLTPLEVFSDILTLNYADESAGIDNPGAKRNTYSLELQAIIRSSGFNPQEHGLLFTHLSQGLFEAERMIQMQPTRPDTPKPTQ